MSHPYPPHLPNFSYTGKYAYSLRFCTLERKPVFRDGSAVDLVCAQFLRAANKQKFELTTYGLMPDHVHGLATGLAESSDCKAFIKAAKQYSAYYFAQERGQRLWERYGYEHVVREDFERACTMRYILENPVRAGLVEHPSDYPYVGSSRYTLDELLQQAGIPPKHHQGECPSEKAPPQRSFRLKTEATRSIEDHGIDY